jgi:hypothetical protein
MYFTLNLYSIVFLISTIVFYLLLLNQKFKLMDLSIEKNNSTIDILYNLFTNILSVLLITFKPIHEIYTYYLLKLYDYLFPKSSNIHMIFSICSMYSGSMFPKTNNLLNNKNIIQNNKIESNEDDEDDEDEEDEEENKEKINNVNEIKNIDDDINDSDEYDEEYENIKNYIKKPLINIDKILDETDLIEN